MGAWPDSATSRRRQQLANHIYALLIANDSRRSRNPTACRRECSEKPGRGQSVFVKCDDNKANSKRDCIVSFRFQKVLTFGLISTCKEHTAVAAKQLGSAQRAFRVVACKLLLSSIKVPDCGGSVLFGSRVRSKLSGFYFASRDDQNIDQ